MFARIERRTLVRAALAALAVLLIASVVINVALLRRLGAYRYLNAPTSDFVAGKCGSLSLVGHWQFDESGVNDVARTPDTSGFSNHARLEMPQRPLSTFRDRLPAHVGGIDGKALEFGGRHWVAAGNNDCFATANFTFSAWIWLESVGNVPTIAGKASWPHNGWWLMTTTAGIQSADRYLDLGIAWPGGQTHVQSGYRLPLREWHHVVVAVDSERHEVQFFVDGRSVSRHRDVPTWQVNWDHDLVLGDYDGTTRWPWLGKLDDVRFYNYVLSADEARALYVQPNVR